jgi:hypothetical protein
MNERVAALLHHHPGGSTDEAEQFLQEVLRLELFGSQMNPGIMRSVLNRKLYAKIMTPSWPRSRSPFSRGVETQQCASPIYSGML